MLRLGFVQRAVSVPLICSTTNTLETQQVEYLLHGDLVAQFFEIDARHDGWFFVGKKQTVPFPFYIWGTGTVILNGPFQVNWSIASRSVYG